MKERFLASYVLVRFQSSGEYLNGYIMSVVAAADILRFAGSESQLVHRMVENLHPRVKSNFLFASRPESVRVIFSFATTVAVAVALEDRRKRLTEPIQQGGNPRPVVNSMIRARFLRPRLISGACGALGHLERDCPSRSRQDRSSGRSGNGSGARQWVVHPERQS
jgi:hypothetical protein